MQQSLQQIHVCAFTVSDPPSHLMSQHISALHSRHGSQVQVQVTATDSTARDAQYNISLHTDAITEGTRQHANIKAADWITRYMNTALFGAGMQGSSCWTSAGLSATTYRISDSWTLHLLDLHGVLASPLQRLHFLIRVSLGLHSR